MLRGMQYSNLTLEMTQKKRIAIIKSYLQSVSYNQMHIDQRVQGAGKSTPIGSCFWKKPLQVIFQVNLSFYSTREHDNKEPIQREMVSEPKYLAA